jgi:hypothetical protein
MQQAWFLGLLGKRLKRDRANKPFPELSAHSLAIEVISD